MSLVCIFYYGQVKCTLQAIGGGAALTKEKATYLSEMREKMGLSQKAAEKVIKGVQNQHLISGLQARTAHRVWQGFPDLRQKPVAHVVWHAENAALGV